MREPTKEEMVEGIAKGLYNWLNLQDYGMYEYRPVHSIPAAIGKAFRRWLDEHPEVAQAMLSKEK